MIIEEAELREMAEKIAKDNFKNPTGMDIMIIMLAINEGALKGMEAATRILRETREEVKNG